MTNPKSPRPDILDKYKDKDQDKGKKEALKEDEVYGLVLDCRDYKEADGILRILQPDDRLVSVYAKGVQRDSSKNRRLVLPFSRVRLLYLPQYSREMLYLMRGASEAYYHKINDDLTLQSVCFVLRDLISEENLYPGIYGDVLSLWESFDSGRREDGYLYACLILSFLIRKAGVEPDFTGCVLCGAKDHLITLSKEEGGLVCSRHPELDVKPVPTARLQAWRALFRAGHEHLEVLRANFSYDLSDFLFFCSWLEYHLDRSWPSIRFLETISAMDAKKKKGNSRGAGR